MKPIRVCIPLGCIPIRMTTIKQQEITSAGEDVGILAPSHFAVGNLNGAADVKKLGDFSEKLNIKLLYYSRNSLISVLSGRIENRYF